MLQSGGRRIAGHTRVVMFVSAAGTVLSLPTVGAGTAHAAPIETWEKLASCESSGNWAINSGNGFYGGVQFTQSSWEAAGGHRFAARADLASKNQQIETAERLLAMQGPGAWPNCGPKAGLARGAAPEERVEPEAPQEDAGPRVGDEPEASGGDTKADTGSRTVGRWTYVTVKPGDTLDEIAHEQGAEGGWSSVYEDNKDTVGDNPDLIRPGQQLKVAT
ncbi:LysM peptidoglycan-binding domain-containing protein [Streptomyces sp. A7024]|uniref:LysM peptidoglycan-binding domain-containing protein n=1 Tax=Streptomyces coryli TaxID=1128680 RepID=A0A6G4U4F7_9ACTN|nr:transglycosylase family protein [Streptomyces coryli]NGN66258.1 LysM peptidoglycan-binding domain-containing protein [Streptomyces coryli]